MVMAFISDCAAYFLCVHIISMVIGERRNRDEGHGDGSGTFPEHIEWSCGSGHHFSQVPPESIVPGLPLIVRWEGGSQVIDEGRQFIHSIGVYVQQHEERGALSSDNDDRGLNSDDDESLKRCDATATSVKICGS